MKLFLCSSYITEELKPDFEKLVGRSTDNFKVAFIPTAINGVENVDPEWAVEDKASMSIFNNWQITDVELETMKGQELKDFLYTQDLIWVNGGMSTYLTKHMHESGLSEYLIELLDSGVIYVGSSAGGMVLSESNEIAQWYPGDEEPGASQVPGLGFFEFQIYPHYEEKNLEFIKSQKPEDQTYYLLKNGQAISFDGDKMSTHGGEVTILKTDKD